MSREGLRPQAPPGVAMTIAMGRAIHAKHRAYPGLVVELSAKSSEFGWGNWTFDQFSRRRRPRSVGGGPRATHSVVCFHAAVPPTRACCHPFGQAPPTPRYGLVGLAFPRLSPQCMLRGLSSLTPIDGHRRGREQQPADGYSPLDDYPIAPISPGDLAEVLDDHTRLLLQRHPKSRRSQILPPLLVIADLSGLVIAYLIATLLSGGDGALGSQRELTLFVLSLPCWVIIAELHGLYHRDEQRADHSTSDDIAGVFHLVTVGVWLLFVASRLVGHNGPGVLNLAVFWLLAVCIIPAARLVAREAFRRSRAYEQNTVIVGAGAIGQLIGRKLIRHPEYGANVVGFVDRLPTKPAGRPSRAPLDSRRARASARDHPASRRRASGDRLLERACR